MKRSDIVITSIITGSLLIISPVVFQAKAFATEKTVKVAEIFRSILPIIRKQTSLTIRLPSQLPSEFKNKKMYVNGKADKNSYKILLESQPNCGANTCFIGFFSASQGDKPSFNNQAIGLVNGTTGYYQPLSCGGSCSPPSIEWLQDGIVYRIQMRVSRNPNEARQMMMQMANSSITGK